MKRTPLQRRTPLKAKTPLKSGSGLARQPMVRRHHKSKAEFEAPVRQEALRRSGGRCEAATPDCTGKVEHLHHRRGRRSGDGSAENALAVCQSCHTFIHAHPAVSYERGWLVRVNAAG